MNFNKIKNKSIKTLASLACFTAGGLFATDTFYVTQFVDSGSAATCSDPTNPSNTCCTFSTALAAANAAGGSSFINIPQTITFDMSQPTSTGCVTEYFINDGVYPIFQGGNSSPGIINYNGAVQCTGTFDLEIGPTSYVILDGVVFQNTLTNGGGSIFLQGTLQINGTSLTTGGGGTFSNILWNTGNANGTSSFVFSPSTTGLADYTDPFAGNINISAGQPNSTLIIVNNATDAVTISGDITGGNEGSTLSIFPTNGDLEFPGDITLGGSGTYLYLVANSGSGTTFLSGSNTISNIFLAGTLSVGSSAVASLGGAEIGFEVTDGVLEITSGGLSLSNTINASGASGVINTTTGTTTFTGTVQGGASKTLILTGNNSLANVYVGTTTNSSGATIPDTFTVSGAIAAGQSFTKTGSGILRLIGTSAYTAATNVNAGILEVLGDIDTSSEVLVAGQALLLGTGSVSNTTVASGGAIKGGTTFGTLSIDGTLTLDDGSFFGTAVTPGQASLIAASGAVSIGDTTLVLAVQGGSGVYAGSTVTILTGSNISGEFTGVDVNGLAANFLTANLNYVGSPVTSVTLGLVARSVENLATGGNAIQVASGLDGAIAFNRSSVSFTISVDPSASSSDDGLLGATLAGGSITIVGSPTPQLADVLATLIPFTTQTEMTYALNQLHPAQTKGAAIVQENNAVRVRESLTQRMLNEINVDNCMLPAKKGDNENNCCDHEKRMMTVWVSGLGDTLAQNNVNNYWGPLAGYRANTGGASAGIDTFFADYFYAGILGGYTNSDVHFKSGKGTEEISTGYGGLYFSAVGAGEVGKMFYGNLAVIGGWSRYNIERNIQYPGVNLTAKSNHGGNQLLSHLDTGLNLDYFGLTIRPFNSFDYITQTERRYSESNAGEWELTVHKKNAIMIRNELGLQFATCYCFADSKWTISPKFSWVREVRIKGDALSVSFTQGGTPFTIEGYFPDRNLFAPGLAVTGMMLKDALTFDLYYNGEFTGGYSSNSVGGQVGYSF